MTASTAVEGRLPDLLSEAATWRLIARLFECPDARWRADLDRLSRELGNEPLQAAVDACGDAATEGMYHSTFGPGGPAPPREASYRESLELGSLMSELAVSYESFGYQPASGEPLDHVAVETGFVAFLTLKEAYAEACHDPDRAQTTADVARRFIGDHLAVVATPLAGALAASPVEYLARASRALADRVGPPPRPVRLPMLPIADEDDGPEFECAL